jgi:hypothetical protein
MFRGMREKRWLPRLVKFGKTFLTYAALACEGECVLPRTPFTLFSSQALERKHTLYCTVVLLTSNF